MFTRGTRFWHTARSWSFDHGDLLVGGDWNHGILNDFPETVGNVIITDKTHSSLFRGVGWNHQPDYIITLLLNLQWKTTIFYQHFSMTWYQQFFHNTSGLSHDLTSWRPWNKAMPWSKGEWRNPPVMTSVISVIYTSKIHPIYTVDGPSDIVASSFF